MLALVLDTNAIHGDPWLASPPGAALLGLADSDACLIVLPEVVRDELHRQRREAARVSHAHAEKGIEAMAQAGVDVSKAKSQLHKAFKKIDADIDGAFGKLLGHKGVVIEPVPDVQVADILARDLARRRPFMEVAHKQNPASVGFRDTLIWETVLAILDPSRGHEKVLLVTADKGFLGDDSTIHPDLLSDLDDRGIDHHRLANVKNVHHAVAVINQAAAQVALVTAATAALYELVGDEVGLQLLHGGDYGYPDFVKFPVPPLENVYISDIDQTSEFALSEDGDVTTAKADATIYLEGAIFKGDWFVDDGETVQLEGVLNDHYFEGSSTVDVHVVVEIDTGGTDHTVLAVMLKS